MVYEGGAFEGRLAAMTRADRLMSSRHSDGALVSALLEQELALVAGDRSRYQLEGPETVLDSGSAYALSLLFHELATNAVRHGALSVDAGRVDVRWHLEEGDLVLSWTETGGPPIRPPAAPGIGNLLVTYTAVKLKGSADLLFNHAGLRCDLRVSLLARWPRRRGAMRLGDARSAGLPLS